MGEVLIQIDGWDPVAAAAVTLRASSIDDASVCHLNGQTWWPELITLPKLRYDLFDGAFTGRISTPGSALSLAVEPWPNLPRWSIADARIRIWTGNAGDAWGLWTQRVDGRVTAQPKMSLGLAEISFAVDDRWLDTPLLTLFAGTGNEEGPASLKGTPKPLALGAPRFVPGVLIDPIDTIFMLSGYGQIEQVETVFERVLRFGGSFGDYPGFATLDVAPIPAGRWASSLPAGLVRFGAPLAGKQSFHMRGDKAGPDGWARKPGQLIRRIALLAGGAGKINDASLNALDAARPYNLSLYVDQQTTARDLIQRIAASVNAVAGVSWLGQLFVAPVAIGAPALTLAADGSALPAVASVEQIEASAPWWRLSLQAERTWAVHELADVAFQRELVDRGAYAAGTTYREGDLVQDQNSTWIYINPTPTAGNAPPALPAMSNAYWKVLAAQGATGISPPLITLSGTHNTFRFNSAGTPFSQSTTLTATRQNTSGTSEWRLLKADGSAITGWTTAAGLVVAGWATSAPNSDQITLDESFFASALGAAATTGLIYEARISSAPTIIDKWTITRINDGAEGAPGGPGAPAIGFVQDATPGAGAFISQTWYRPTSKEWYRWDGSAWQRILGNLSAQDLIADSAFLANGVIINAKIGNLQVDNAKIANLSVDGQKVVDNTATLVTSAASDPAVGVAVSATVDGVSVSFTSTGKPTSIFVTFDSSRGGTSSTSVMQFSIIRVVSGVETVVSRLVRANLNTNGPRNINFEVDTPPAGPVQYKVRYAVDSGTGSWIVSNQNLSVLEARK